jgi:hypothetical protein
VHTKRLRADEIRGLFAINQFRVFFLFHLLSRNVKVKIYKTIILPVVLYRYETWSLTLRERDEVTGEWRKLHNKELHNLYSSLNIRQSKSRKMRWAGHVACIGRGKCTRFWWESPKERDHLED